MAVYWHMGKDLQEAFAAARKSLKENKSIPIGAAALIKQLSTEVESHIRCGDWKTATKFSYYLHEIAKLNGCLDWYDVFLRVRKSRDRIALIVEELNGKD